jgi:hypothetical protein
MAWVAENGPTALAALVVLGGLAAVAYLHLRDRTL